MGEGGVRGGRGKKEEGKVDGREGWRKNETKRGIEREACGGEKGGKGDQALQWRGEGW